MDLNFQFIVNQRQVYIVMTKNKLRIVKIKLLVFCHNYIILLSLRGIDSSKK